MHTEEYDEDYEEERATEYRAILDEEDKLLHHSSWKRDAPSIDRTVSTSIDTQPHQTNRKRASTNIAYYPSIKTGVDRVREGDYSIGSWADDHHHESYAVETEFHEPEADELHKGFTYEELLNMQRRDEADQHQAEATGERTRFSQSIDRATRLSIDKKPQSSIDIRPKPKSTVREKPNFDNQYLTQDEFGIFRNPDGYAREIDGHALQVSREDVADILQMANGAENLFMQQRTVPAHQRPEFGRRAFDLFGTRKFYWEENDEYGVYRDDQGCARDVDGHIINVSKEDIRKLMERASRDEHSYICLPEHVSSFTQTKLVPEIYTKDEINEMFYRFYGAQERIKVYRDDQGCARDVDGHIINVSKEDIRKLMERASRDEHSYICLPEHVSSFTQTKLVPEIYTKDEINEMFYRFYGAQERIKEERLDRRCDDIYFPMDLSMNALTSQIEAIKTELVEIQSYIARRPEASASIDRRTTNRPTFIDRQRSTTLQTRGRLVPKVTSDVSDTHTTWERRSQLTLMSP
ncbi:hypothetical protein DY000_02006551 [Brassica cretica]|uniref:Uncharacterized protein n=1 Tax=Brassica cretica TaxID=69181 RepID=A0ABQ7CI66_BRACR|nr:hypothetical protein DY000_02006551 [Brassica cretica]